ncbi:hypothetical protein ES703_74996 [subsurface metagenome]
MNPETLLNEAAEAIENRGLSVVGSYHVCFVDDKIQCLSTAQPVKKEFIFETYPGHELTKGLTSKQWNRLSRKIGTFFERKAHKCQPQKP